MPAARIYEAYGEARTAKEWECLFGVNPTIINDRYWAGWGPEDTVSEPGREGLSKEERFWLLLGFCELDPHKCWEWPQDCIGILGPGKRRYGTFDGGMAHREAYEIQGGGIPEGYHIDHLCRNIKCVRKSHLEPVLPEENIRRGFSPAAINARKLKCDLGHEYSMAKNGTRVCKKCSYEKNKKWFAKNNPPKGPRVTCHRDHPYTEESTGWNDKAKTKRFCRICRDKRYKELGAQSS